MFDKLMWLFQLVTNMTFLRYHKNGKNTMDMRWDPLFRSCLNSIVRQGTTKIEDSGDPDEEVHGSRHLHQHCLQIQLYSFQALVECYRNKNTKVSANIG